jgi:glycosyltransferase involved in cell wall biosynthesis
MKVLVDGRVYSSGAWDRGMGRYVEHVIELLLGKGHEVCLLLFQDCYLQRSSPLLQTCTVRYANYSAENLAPTTEGRYGDAHGFTTFLANLVEADGFDLYVDATPFLAPMRFDLLACPVVTICYDFIPLKLINDYITNEVIVELYYNGLSRVLKADHVISISETVADEAGRFLGIPQNRLSVISPRLDPMYENWIGEPAVPGSAGYLFGMVGGHRSKNPDVAIRMYRDLVDAGVVNVRVNAPTRDQFETLKHGGLLDDIEATYSISEERKLELQSQASVVSHLSLEEGFGIPLLEAIFLKRKVVVLDIPMNREILGKSSGDDAGAVFWLDPSNQTLPLKRFAAFLKAEPDPAYFEGVRTYYNRHWRESAEVADQALKAAVAASEKWFANVEFKIFSSIPGDFCGVADYSLCYVRSTDANVVLFFSEGDQKTISHTPNLRLATQGEYAAFQKRRPAVPGVFNLAFSRALYPGIELLRDHAAADDILLVHERAYVPGLWHFKAQQGRLDDLALDLPRTSEAVTTAAATDLALSPMVNKRKTADEGRSALSPHWLLNKPLKFVSHLPDPVLEKMREARQADSELQNDLDALEDSLEFVPLGIDPRGGPAVARAAQALRRERGIQADDVVVGHFGLILDDIKRLAEIIYVTANFIAEQKAANAAHRTFFVLSGKIIDQKLFDNAKALFANLGIASRLIYSNPVLEVDFDAEIAMCDAVICFRKQVRGQLSHIFVRALSMGRPVIVNEDSGYAYDPRLLVRDGWLQDDLYAVLGTLSNPLAAQDLREVSHVFYEAHHRGDDSLKKILQKKRPWDRFLTARSSASRTSPTRSWPLISKQRPLTT